MIASRSPADVRSRLDFWQALSGAALALFIYMHHIFVGSAVLSITLYNFIAGLMEDFYIAHITAPVVVLLIVFHAWIAARKMPFRCGELGIFVRHSRALRDLDTWLWLVQVVTAVVIIVGMFFHVYTLITNLPITAEVSAKRMHNGWSFFYAVFMPCIVLHTSLGVYRLAVKFGYCCKNRRFAFRKGIFVKMACLFILAALALTRFWFMG